MTGELIGIRETARRLGVSDTAVHKAIRSGRITIAQRHPTNDRPLLAWPQVAEDWARQTDASRRTHVGGTGDSPVRKKYAGKPEIVLPTAGGQASTSLPGGPSYAQARAIREGYEARLAKLEYEERIGKLVSVEAVKVDAYKVGRQVRDALLNIPDRVAHEIAAETRPDRVHDILTRELRVALEALRAGP